MRSFDDRQSLMFSATFLRSQDVSGIFLKFFRMLVRFKGISLLDILRTLVRSSVFVLSHFSTFFSYVSTFENVSVIFLRFGRMYVYS